MERRKDISRRDVASFSTSSSPHSPFSLSSKSYILFVLTADCHRSKNITRARDKSRAQRNRDRETRSKVIAGPFQLDERGSLVSRVYACRKGLRNIISGFPENPERFSRSPLLPRRDPLPVPWRDARPSNASAGMK